MMKEKRCNISNIENIFFINTIEDSNNKLYIKRDDLLPFSFGGNKVRKALYFFDDLLSNQYNYVITYRK